MFLVYAETNKKSLR